MSLRLADSEQQEICAAFDKARKALQLAREATGELQAILEKRIACFSEQRMTALRKESGQIGNALFRLNVQQCIVKQYGVDRTVD